MDALNLAIAIACGLIAAVFVALCVADLRRSARIRRIAPPRMYVYPPVRVADIEDDNGDTRGCA